MLLQSELSTALSLLSTCRTWEYAESYFFLSMKRIALKLNLGDLGEQDLLFISPYN
jgi:hypothetical protein